MLAFHIEYDSSSVTVCIINYKLSQTFYKLLFCPKFSPHNNFPMTIKETNYTNI